MGLWTKIAAGIVLVGAGAALAIFAFGIGGVTPPQLQSVAKTNEDPSRALPAKPAPLPPESAEANWRVNCTGAEGQPVCLATQSIYGKRTGRPLLSVAIRVASDAKQPVLLLKLPLSIYLPAGVLLRIGNEPEKVLPVDTCVRSGCAAESTLTEAEIAAMLKGARLTVSVQDRRKKAVTFRLPGAGFDAAYARIN